MKKRILIALGSVAAVVGLVACGEPTGQVSPSGTNYSVTFTKKFQLAAGQPLVRAACVGHGENFWRYSAEENVQNHANATITLVAHCPTGVAAGSWESRPS